MAAHGITGEILKWVEAWLSGREQRVILNGKASQWSKVASGVPQGSVLGPTLFVIYINDIDNAIDIISGFISKFADDTKVGRTIIGEEDREALQVDINNLSDWASPWQMQFNAGKCKVLHIGNQNPKFCYTMGGHAPAGAVLEETIVEKDVGVLVHNTLKPREQCVKASKKANQVLGQMTRALHYRDKDTFVRLYVQYCRPHLEYAIQSWNPWYQQDIDILENVQKRAMKMVSGLKGNTYEERLKEVGLTSLRERRERGDMIHVWKILHEKDDVKPSLWFKFASKIQSGAITRNQGKPWNLQIPSAVKLLDIRINFFSHRVVEPWNSLPHEIQDSANINIFKNRYDAHFQPS